MYAGKSPLKIDFRITDGSPIELDGRTIRYRRHRMIFYPATVLHAGLRRWNGKQIQFRRCTFAGHVVRKAIMQRCLSNASVTFDFSCVVSDERLIQTDESDSVQSVLYLPARVA